MTKNRDAAEREGQLKKNTEFFLRNQVILYSLYF